MLKKKLAKVVYIQGKARLKLLYIYTERIKIKSLAKIKKISLNGIPT